MGKGGDVEAGFPPQQWQGDPKNLMYPTQVEPSELRWGFIRKVYSIIAIQLLFTAAFASIFIFFPPARKFVVSNDFVPLFALVAAFIVSFIILFILSKYYKKHPLNLILLGLYTLCVSVSVGFACALFNGNIVLEAALLTGAVVVGLTGYTFWAAKRGKDFSFLGPFLFASTLVLLLFAIIQIIFPLGPMGRMIYSCVGALLMCGYIVYDTDDVIKRYTYDEYIWAAISIYGDIIGLFLHLLSILGILDY